MHTGYIHSIDTFGSVDGPGVRFVVFMQGCLMRCRYCHNPGYMGTAKGLPLPDASTRTSGASALSEGVSCPSKHTGSQEITPEALLRQALRYRSYWARGAAASPSAAENRSFKLTFYVNFPTCQRTAHSHHTGHRGTAIYHRRTFLFPPDHAFRAHRSCYSGSETHRSGKTSSSDWALQRIHSFLCPVFRPDS